MTISKALQGSRMVQGLIAEAAATADANEIGDGSGAPVNRCHQPATQRGMLRPMEIRLVSTNATIGGSRTSVRPQLMLVSA